VFLSGNTSTVVSRLCHLDCSIFTSDINGCNTIWQNLSPGYTRITWLPVVFRTGTTKVPS